MDRWKATVTYRTNNGPLDVEHSFEELFELHDLIERGPHWDTIERIVVKLARPADARDLTIEVAETL